MKKGFTFLAIAGLLMASPISLKAQKTYSLDECIRLSLKNNLQVKNGQLDLQSVDSRIRQAKSGLLPSVDMNGSYQYYLTMPKMLVPAEFFGGVPGQYAEVAFGSEQTTSAGLQVSQIVYNQKVFIGLKAAKTAKNLTELQVNKTKEDLIYNVSAVYYNLQVVEQNLSLLDSNIVALDKILETSRVLQSNEIISRSNLKRLQINSENLRNERNNLKLTGDKAYNLLKFLMGVPLTEEIHILDVPLTETLLANAAVQIENRTDLMMLKEQVQLAELDKKASVAEFYPSLAGVYNYGVTGYNNKVDPFRTIGDNWMRSSYVALQLNIPIFSGGNRTQKVRQKEFEIQKARNQYELLKQSALKEVADASNNFLSSSNSFENAKRSLGLAQDVFKSSWTEYIHGLLSLSDILQIQNELTAARNNYSTALIHVRLADIEWKKAKGELTEIK